MGSLHLEGAVRRPQIDAVCDTSAPALVDLAQVSLGHSRDSRQETQRPQMMKGAKPRQEKDRQWEGDTHHFGRLRTRDVEFQIGVLLPVSEKKRELEEEPVVGIA